KIIFFLSWKFYGNPSSRRRVGIRLSTAHGCSVRYEVERQPRTIRPDGRAVFLLRIPSVDLSNCLAAGAVFYLWRERAVSCGGRECFHARSRNRQPRRWSRV